MLSLKPLPAFKDNYIWVLSGPDGQAVIVDPGQAAPVLAEMERGLRPIAIFLTHHHVDHIGGAAELLDRLDIPCYAPHEARIACATHRVADGDSVDLPALGLRFEVMAIPGHTSSHIAFHGAGHLFAGDTLFSLGCGRMFEGSPEQMLASLDRLAALPGETRLCCGHEYTLANARFAAAAEPDNAERAARVRQAQAQRNAGTATLPSQLASERDCNPFLRIDQPGVLATLAARGEAVDQRVSAFAALRRWKDQFA